MELEEILIRSQCIVFWTETIR